MAVLKRGLRTFEPRWEKLISGWEHVHNANLNNLLNSPNTYYVLVFTGIAGPSGRAV